MAKIQKKSVPLGPRQAQHAQKEQKATGEISGAKVAAKAEFSAIPNSDFYEVETQKFTPVSIPAAAAKAFCEEGGSLAFKFKSKVVKGKARVTHAGKAGRAAAIEFGGKTLKTLFGTDTLRSTGVSVHGGVRANFISKKLNAGVSGVAYFPPLNVKDKAGPENKEYTDAMTFEWGGSVATPVGGGGYNSRRGFGAKVNLLFMSASFDEFAERVFVGIPGVAGVTFGKDKERGSEVSIGAGVGLAGDAELGAYAGYGVTIHTSLLDPVNKYFTRPIAQTVVNTNNKVVGAVKNFVRKVQGKEPLEEAAKESAPDTKKVEAPSGDSDAVASAE